MFLNEAFEAAMAIEGAGDQAVVRLFENVGNWRTIFPLVKEKLPSVDFEATAKYPVVFGAEEALYLKNFGPKGGLEFRLNVGRLLSENRRVVVFDTQKIVCLRENPSCVSDLLAPGKSAVMFYRNSVPLEMLAHLEQANSIEWSKIRVQKDEMTASIETIATSIVQESVQLISRTAADDERSALALVSGDSQFMRDVADELEDLFIEGSFGAPKLREQAKRRIVSSVLRLVVPKFSAKDCKDAVDFFNETLRERFERYNLPAAYIGEVSPNLSYVIKSAKRFNEIGSDSAIQ